MPDFVALHNKPKREVNITKSLNDQHNGKSKQHSVRISLQMGASWNKYGRLGWKQNLWGQVPQCPPVPTSLNSLPKLKQLLNYYFLPSSCGNFFVTTVFPLNEVGVLEVTPWRLFGFLCDDNFINFRVVIFGVVVGDASVTERKQKLDSKKKDQLYNCSDRGYMTISLEKIFTKIIETKSNNIPQVTAVIASFTVLFKLEHVVASRSIILFLIAKSDSKVRSLHVQMIGLFFSFLKKEKTRIENMTITTRRKFTLIIMSNLKRKLEKAYAQYQSMPKTLALPWWGLKMFFSFGTNC